uniref:Chromosome 4 open reading frame 54 n=1 Tax=Myripristis murdjan TaxID=586833 RepID=A0A667Y6U6_9TELE
MKTKEASVETPTQRERGDLLQKAARGGGDAPGKQDEANYVDLDLIDLKAGETKPAKVSYLAEGNQTVLINSSGAGAPCVMDTNPEQGRLANQSDTETKGKEDANVRKCAEDDTEGRTGTDPPSSSADHCVQVEECVRSQETDSRERNTTQPDLSKEEETKNTTSKEESHNIDNYLSGGSVSEDFEEEDDVSLVLSDDCVPCVTEDESHYITTHEIQLSELSDHEGDYENGVGSSSWDIEDDNQVYSFVDYASFDGDGAVGERGKSHPTRPHGAAAVSTLLESDLCDAAKFTSSDESLSKAQQQCSGNSAGQIHLSIKTTSRAINDPSNIQEKGNILYHAKRSGDMSRYVFRGADGKAGKLRDSAKCFIAAPGRLHFGSKLKGKEVTEYSSGASSAVSELDDADKEVRNLTARAFKSLAYPYFDAINFSTSSESSASEHGIGINRWSTFVDLKYGNVNMSQGLDQSMMAHKNSTSSFEIAKNIDNKGYKGVALASIKPPPSKIFTLNGNPHSASSSTKKIELMGKFGQGQSGVITLTETLNFRCNVKSGMSGGERRAKFAQNAAGSRSTDEVTNSLPSGQRRGARRLPCNAGETMEDTHKKAIFASSLIKNVISKKMQFEQERKMERGEICEPHQISPCFAHQESESHKGKGSRELHRQSSKFSETSSDFAIMCVDEIGDIVDSGSCDTKSDSRRQDDLTLEPETNFEPTNEAGIDTKKGALEASKSTLLRSQNSAFRCWKDGELEFQKEHKNDKTPEENPPSPKNDPDEGGPYTEGSSKLTKMSHLFVPSIQLLSSDGEVGQQSVATSKSPEIKINLRSVRDNKVEPFGVSKLRAPSIGCNAASLLRTDDFRCQALAAALKGESSDKVPHFMVRDIRDNNKGKLQTPIHQVRDVRKLVKSSYHFVSLDNNDNKSSFATADPTAEQKKQVPYRNPASVSPIVIKCQSVNTNSHGKQSGNLIDLSKGRLNEEPFDIDRCSPEGAKSGSLLQRPLGRAATGSSNKVDSSEGAIGLRIETRTASRRQEKTSDIAEKKPESKMANQVALEKLQAAVKTMEQLYVFDRNEWKRKSEPQPLTDSHVLSLIASEEHGGSEDEGGRGSSADRPVRRDSYTNIDKIPPVAAASPGNETLFRREEKDPPKNFQSHTSRDERLSLNAITQTPYSTKGLVHKSPKVPVSLKISQMRHQVDAKEKHGGEVDRSAQNLFSASADNENYLTIPIKSHASSSKQATSGEKTSVYTITAQSHEASPPSHVGPSTSIKGREDHNQSPKRSSIVMETRSPEIPAAATIYHSLPLSMPANQPQVFCFSPTITPTPTLEPFQATQRKMLLDPTTGNYYLVDTPVQPATKRLFDPETGQYVDVPMPQPPMTPMPMPMAPLALSPGAYGHTYMIYPGFVPTPPVISAGRLAQSQMSAQSDSDSGDKALSQQTEGIYMESPYYMATGKSPQTASGAQQQTAANRPLQGFSTTKQPIISITSQQGPRIIAPPSFDGTTMSFVVEHR